jgi:hypothetical protein
MALNYRALNLAARDAAPVVGTYICDVRQPDCPDRDLTNGPLLDAHCWHESTARRLAWQGGPSEGAEADLALWNRLGRRNPA